MEKLTVNELKEMNALSYDINPNSRVVIEYTKESDSDENIWWVLIKATDVFPKESLTELDQSKGIIHVGLYLDNDSSKSRIRIFNHNIRKVVKTIPITETYDESMTNEKIVELVLNYLR